MLGVIAMAGKPWRDGFRTAEEDLMKTNDSTLMEIGSRYRACPGKID